MRRILTPPEIYSRSRTPASKLFSFAASGLQNGSPSSPPLFRACSTVALIFFVSRADHERSSLDVVALDPSSRVPSMISPVDRASDWVLLNSLPHTFSSFDIYRSSQPLPDVVKRNRTSLNMGFLAPFYSPSIFRSVRFRRSALPRPSPVILL